MVYILRLIDAAEYDEIAVEARPVLHPQEHAVR